MENREIISKKIGAGWWKKNGELTYVSASVKIEGKEYHLTLFPNNFKQHEKQPDWNVLMNVN